MSHSVLPATNLAQATGTRLDSACKHICVARVHADAVWNDFEEYAKESGMAHTSKEQLKTQKHDFSVEKMDLLANTSYKAAKRKLPKLHYGAYTPVTNRKWVSRSFKGRIYQHFRGMQEDIQNNKKEHYVIPGNSAPFRMSFVGLSLGHADADSKIGDTAVSAMTGGMVTIRNGPHAIHPGSQIFWGVLVTNDHFDNVGKKPKRNSHQQTKHDLHKFVIAPYDPVQHRRNGFPPTQIIGKALTGARPWEMVDLLLCRQHSMADFATTGLAALVPIGPGAVVQPGDPAEDNSQQYDV